MPIETNRLILRDLVASDASSMLLLVSDPQVTKYLDYFDFTDLQGATSWVSEFMGYNFQTPRSSHNLVIEQKTTHEFVGWIGYGETSDQSKSNLDFGYAIQQKFWSKGFASEALQALIILAWNETTALKITGECRSENTASAKVMQKSGMQLEGEFEKAGHKSSRYSIVRTNLQ